MHISANKGLLLCNLGCSCSLFSTSAPATAFDYAVKLRAKVVNKAARSTDNAKPAIKNPVDASDGAVLPNKLTWSFAGLTDAEVVDFLAKNVIWDKYDILAINKPYNVCCQDGKLPRGAVNLLAHLPALAARFNCAHLHPVHRLDRTSTGVLLLAKTERLAQHLKQCFKERSIGKYYYCITRDVPSPAEGVIDIPLEDGALHADGKRRMSLRPKASELAAARVVTPASLSAPGMSLDWREAVTAYRVVDQFKRCALVEVQPKTGVTHQIRVHLGLGLSTPVLGDHKYSSVHGCTMPQRLSEGTLMQLGLRPSRARDLPLFLHSQRLEVPLLISGDAEHLPPGKRTSVIKAPFPFMFARTLRKLKLSLPFTMMISKFI